MYNIGSVKRTKKVKEFEDKIGMDIEVFIYSMYVEKRCPTQEIAKILGTTPATVCTWLDKMGIERRKMTYV